MGEDSGHDQIVAAALWAGVSHDLRQPVQSMLLLIHIAARTKDQGVLQRTLGYMEHGLLAMQEMIEAIGKLSRLEAGIGCPARTAMKLADLVVRAETSTATGLVGRNLRIEVSGAQTVIEGDPALLVMALGGLIAIAGRSSADGVVEVNGQTCNGRDVITCKYIGNPVTRAQQTAYFTELPPRESELPAGGLAFGLAFIERLVAAMGWHLAVTGRKPQGVQSLVLSRAAAT